jgi:parvulin-like peptidyl-prolyl isomerase
VDGEDVASVAAAASVGVENVRAALDSLPTEMAQRLLSSSPGEPLGPFESEDAFEIVVLIHKQRPTVAEPEIRKRAEAHLLARHEEAAMHRSVQWEWRA